MGKHQNLFKVFHSVFVCTRKILYTFHSNFWSKRNRYSRQLSENSKKVILELNIIVRCLFDFFFTTQCILNKCTLSRMIEVAATARKKDHPSCSMLNFKSTIKREANPSRPTKQLFISITTYIKFVRFAYLNLQREFWNLQIW
jgi:hypothetical protein